MAGNYIGYKMDIVFCIDNTYSMYPCINEIKDKAKHFSDICRRTFENGNKPISQLRVKVVEFGDFASDGPTAIMEHGFYTLPDQNAEFEAAINSISLVNEDGSPKGGDIPENGWEAVVTAMRSDWTPIDTRAGEKGRHIICVLTDAPPLELGARQGCIGYPDNMPGSTDELFDIWEGGTQEFATALHPNYKRLVVFGPADEENGNSWAQLGDLCDAKILFTEVNAAAGLRDVDMEGITNEILASC